MISDALHIAINALHQAIADEGDPQDKAMLAQCLQNMLRVQQRNFAEAQQPGAGGGGGGNALGVPGRRSALISQLAGGQG